MLLEDFRFRLEGQIVRLIDDFPRRTHKMLACAFKALTTLVLEGVGDAKFRPGRRGSVFIMAMRLRLLLFPGSEMFP